MKFLLHKLLGTNNNKPELLPPLDEPAELGDQTYEDALLGLQVRRYFNEEYGSAEPPPEVFSRVMLAIRDDKLAAYGKVQKPRRITVSAFGRMSLRLMNSALVARVVPGAAAFVLMISSFGPGLTEIFDSGASLYSAQPTAVAAQSVETPHVSSSFRTVAEKSDALRLQAVKLDPGKIRMYDPLETLAPPDAYARAQREMQSGNRPVRLDFTKGVPNPQ